MKAFMELYTLAKRFCDFEAVEIPKNAELGGIDYSLIRKEVLL